MHPFQVPLLDPAFAGAPHSHDVRSGPDAVTPVGALVVAFARDSAFDVDDPESFESGLSAAELGEAMDGVDFFGVLSSGTLAEPEVDPASGQSAAPPANVEASEASNDPSRAATERAVYFRRFRDSRASTPRANAST